METEKKNSPEYETALTVSREADRVYRDAQFAYRNGRMDDDAFLAARAAYTASQAEFDRALLAELERPIAD